MKYYTHSLVFSIRNSWAISPKKLDFDILVLMWCQLHITHLPLHFEMHINALPSFVVCDFMNCYFFQEWDDRLEEDSLLIERILLLIRNILHIPANKQAEKVHVNIDISNALYSLYLLLYNFYFIFILLWNRSCHAMTGIKKIIASWTSHKSPVPVRPKNN